ncbi:Gypsy retrotransposon integrase protein 1 [Biomphalaria glabrata]|nr:Gypsy retrotransposon integrase protein 1 [Biomphalaria glabrata]
MERRRKRRKQGNKHISLAAIKQYLLYGTYPSGSTPSDKRSVRKRAESFKIEDGELYYVVRPKRIEGEPLDQNPGASKANLRKAILTPKNQLSIAALVHVQGGGAHMGTERTFSALSAKYYWVGMANTVRKVLKNCVICLANRPFITKLQQPTSQTNCISQVTNVDIAVHNDSEVPAEKEESFCLSESDGHKFEENSLGMKYIITSELPEPDQVDSDLDFDPETVISDALFNPKSHRFWQKVEVQIYGPFPYKKKSVYIIASLDCFSKWPEANKIDKINERTVSQFCLKLIARFGVMEQLIILENEVTKSNSLDLTGLCLNLSQYNVAISKESINPLDESWNRLSINLHRFVDLYVNSWNDCLDLCLIPLRNSLVRNTDFTPSFLLMNREPIFPECVIAGKGSSEIEVELNQGQIEQSVDTVMSHYIHCAVSDIKRIVPPVGEIVNEETLDKKFVRRSGRKPKKINCSEVDDHETDDGSETSDQIISKEFSLKKSQQQIASQGKKKSESLDTIKTTEKQPSDEDGYVIKEIKHSEETLEKIDLDTYYRLIMIYLKDEAYPETFSDTLQRHIKELSANYVYENGELMFKQKGKLTKVPTCLADRLRLLKESHINNGEHLSKAKVQEHIESKDIFWKDMILDIKSFVSACPGCRHGETRRKRRTSKKFVRWYRGAEEEDNSDTELETAGDLGKVSNDELIDYLKQDTTPTCLSRSELLIFRKKAKNFKLEKGILFFWPNKRTDLKPRKVILSEKERLDVLKKIHGDNHLDKSSMLESLKKQYFWQTMYKDVDKFLSECCQADSIQEPEDDNDHCDPAIELRQKLFQDYFAGKNVFPQQEQFQKFISVKDVTVTKPKQDLVAAAMESAQLTDQAISSEEPWEMPCEADNVQHMNEESTAAPVTGHPQQVLSSTNHIETPKLELETNIENEVAKSEVKQEVFEGSKEEINSHEPITRHLTKSGISKKSHIRRRCDVCQEVIKGENNYKEHMYKHTRIKPFSCSLCHKKLTSIKGLNMHARRHSGHRPYLCNICGRGFPRSASLRYHIKTHDKGGGVPVACDVCNRSFSTENRMQKHKRFKHPAQAPVFRCDQCGKVFTAKRSLKRHEEAHQGIRKFECQYCQRSFFRKEYLNYHLVSHSNEDPSLANYKNKGKLKRAMAAQKKRDFSSKLSIVCLDPSTIEVAQDQEVYSQLVEDPNHQDWSEIHGDGAIVYGLEGTHRVEEVDPDVGEATTLVMVEEQPGEHGNVEVRHIILPRDQRQGQISLHSQGQISLHNPGQISLHTQQQTLQELPQHHQSIELALPTGTHTFTLPSGSQLQAIDSGLDSVQYQVECLPGDTLTEADINAIHMLAQASLSGTHIIQ